MIGMNQIKKRLINGILIGLGIGLVIVIIMLIVTNNIIKGYEEGTSERFNNTYMTTVKTFKDNVIQGETITEDMIMDTSIPKTTKPANTTSSVVGMIAKYNVPMRVAITSDMVADSIVSSDVRIQEIGTIVLPSDLVEGEYVDIRMTMPNGVEYIVLAQKKVNAIVNNTIKMNLSEEDILVLNGAIVDAYLNEGVKLYAVKYADPTTQIKLDEKSMEEAKTYITNKITEDLLTKGAIREETENDTTLTAATSDNDISSTNNSSLIGNLVDNVLNNKKDEDTTKEETVVAATGDTVAKPQDKYQVSVGKLKGDDLIELVTKYAIEYRYYVEAYNKVESNYQPNTYIIAFMKQNKYIVEQAKKKLETDIRMGIQANITSFEGSVSEEKYAVLVTKLQQAIEEQKALRTTTLNP